MSIDERLDEIRKILSQEIESIYFLTVDTRVDSSPISASTLDAYVIANGFKGLGFSWIELPRKSATQHISLLLAQETIQEHAALEPTQTAADKFISLFADDARFFCNGVMFPLDGHRIIDAAAGSMEVSTPFYSGDYSQQALLRAWKELRDEVSEDVFGIVAIDSRCIGLFLINPRWMADNC